MNTQRKWEDDSVYLFFPPCVFTIIKHQNSSSVHCSINGLFMGFSWVIYINIEIKV